MKTRWEGLRDGDREKNVQRVNGTGLQGGRPPGRGTILQAAPVQSTKERRNCHNCRISHRAVLADRLKVRCKTQDATKVVLFFNCFNHQLLILFWGFRHWTFLYAANRPLILRTPTSVEYLFYGQTSWLLALWSCMQHMRTLSCICIFLYSPFCLPS